MKEGLPRSHARRVLEETKGGPCMLYAGLDLSRKRLDFHLELGLDPVLLTP
jgi:hypothetical protein